MDDPAHTAPDAGAAEVVVGVDGSAGGERAVRWAAETAAARGLRLRMLHGLDLDAAHLGVGSPAIMLAPVGVAWHDRGTRLLASARGWVRRSHPELTVITELVEGDPAVALVDRSASAALVVLGAADTAGGLAHLGSVLLQVVTYARGPVVVVRDGAFEQRAGADGPVVAGVDGDRGCDAVLAAAFGEARARRTELVAVHCLSSRPDGSSVASVDERSPEPVTDPGFDGRLAAWAQGYPDVTVRGEVHPSGPRHHLLRWSRTAQLVVIGSRRRSRLTGLLLGSTGVTVVRHAHCPVLVAHPR